MKNKIVALIAVAAVAVVALAGCGQKQEAPAADQGSAPVEASAPAETSAPVVPLEAADPVETQTVYVTPAWLRSALAGAQEGYENVVVAQVVYDASGDKGTYGEGHVPGAILVSDVDVEDAVGTEEEPYNLLAADVMEANALKAGITKDTKVVLYGEDAAGTARVAYGLLWLGVEDVKILNGGFAAWKAAGYEVDMADNAAVPATDFGVAVPAHPEYWVSMDEAIERLANDDNFKLVSIRAEGEWLGETSGYDYIDRAGEPEGAVWGKGCETAFDVAGFLNADGTVKGLAGIEEVWADCDFSLDNHLSFYCGTGWRATVPFLVLYENGYRDISVYDGGWYEWQMHGENAVQVGDPASADCEHTTVDKLPTDKAAK